MCLWQEGLAVYVATQLNPGASGTNRLLLTYPSSLRAAVDAHRTEALCAVQARLPATDQKDVAPLFMGGSTPLSSNLPPRFGYYVGYLSPRTWGRRGL